VSSDDRILVERCQAGDLTAFEPLVEKYRQRVWRLAHNVLRDREEAWDVAQDAFVRAYQALPSFRGQSAFYTWLFRIVMNLAADRVRQRAARGRAFGTERVPEEDWERIMTDQGVVAPDSSAAQTEDRARIVKALDTLSDDHRTIIMLSDLEGLSYREIAEVLDVPMGTVMSRLHNARKRLRDALGSLLALVVAVLLTWGASPVSAQTSGAPVPSAPEAVAPPVVRVHIGARVFLASDGPPPADMQPFPPDARVDTYVLKLRQFLRYRQYHPLQQTLGEVPVGTTHRAALAGDRQLELTPEGMGERAVRLRVRLVRGNLTEVTTSIAATPGTPAVIGGPRYGDGVLIILLWANPNR